MSASIIDFNLVLLFISLFYLTGCDGKHSEDPKDEVLTLTAAYPNNVYPGNSYDYTPMVDNPGGRQLTFAIDNLPPWSQFDETNGRLYGIPVANDVGRYDSIVVSASDGEQSARTNAFFIDVSIDLSNNQPPNVSNISAITPANVEIEIELGPLQDDDGDVLTYRLFGTENANSGAQANRIFYSSDVAGTEVFQFTVADGINDPVGASVTVVVTEVTNNITYYISPDGDDSNDGLSTTRPWRTFAKALDSESGGISSGDELILLDGTYSLANGTGILRAVNNVGSPIALSAAIPSGVSRDIPTVIRAANPGQVVIAGPSGVEPLHIGRSFRKDRFIKIQGITFEGGGSLYNTEYVVVKDCGFYGSFGIGTNDHDQGNQYNLIEDVWVWANNRRVVASNYRGNYNLWRRIIIRSEGCDQLGCEGFPKPDPSVGITVYDSHDVSMQNIIVIDRQLRADSAYADFATAQHTSNEDYFMGRIEWLGSMSVNSDDAGLLFEADSVMTTGDLIWTIKDFVVVGSSEGINIGNKPYNYDAAGQPASLIENATVILTQPAENSSGIRVTPEQSNVLVRNSVTMGATRAGYNMLGSSVENSASYNPDSSEGEFDISQCNENCIILDSDPLTDDSIIFPVRVEANTNLDNVISGVSLGANVLYRYGADGTTMGDANAISMSNESLWPWPNESRIKQEMCVNRGITRGFCTTETRADGSPVTLTSYIWEYLGTPMPESFY